jgi:DNA modification methylase
MSDLLLHEDSFDALCNIADKSVALVLTDPPYDFTDNQKSEIFTEFCRICTGAIIVFCPPENQWNMEVPCQYLFWTKPVSTKNTSKSYSRFVEMIQIWYADNGAWNCKGHWSNYVNVFTDYVDGAMVHPFQKPMSLMRRLILNHSNVGDVVLDSFMGSGTTGIAAQFSGRGFIGIEKDKDIYDCACNRINASGVG